MNLINDKKIGCIGTGNMGAAILSSLRVNIKKENIYCFDVENSKLESIRAELGIQTLESIVSLTDICDIIILAVKPDVIKSILKEIKDKITKKIIISIAAGISTEEMSKIVNSSKNIIRVMPNTPALVGLGMSVISTGIDADKTSLKIAEEIFSFMGKALILPEKLMDAVTAVSGSGPAYGFTLIQAMADGGVKMGLPRDKAIILAAQTILGSAKMVLEGKDDPITLRGKVTSPGGTTIEAVHILERAGFSGILMDAIEAAKKKSEELGSK